MSRAAVSHLKRADPTLAAIIARVGPCRFVPERQGTHFDAIVRSIVYQQLSGKAASTIHGRVKELFGGRSPTPREIATTSDEALRSAGLSGQKVSYVRDLAQRVITGDVPLESLDTLPDEEIITSLSRVKGVGRWTAQMFLMFRLGRPDVLPELDLGIRNAMVRAYRLRVLPKPERMQRIARPWAPYRTVACWYLWRSLDADMSEGGE